MARRRKGGYRRTRTTVRYVSRPKRRSGRKASKGISLMGTLLPAFGYGALRPYAANLVSPITGMIPAGSYSDNLVLGGIGYFAAKKGKGMLSNIGKAMLIVEAAQLGSEVIGGSAGSSNAGWK